MIGKISGRLDWRGMDHVLIDVRGVGYMVYCSDRVLAGMPGIGEAVALYTDLLVREDNLQLFGFPTLVEKEWHRLLMSVQGVGAKASLAIQGALGAEGISRALALGDWNALAKAKGIGPKTAQRVVMELKDKAPSVMAMGDSGAEVATADPIVVEALDAKPVSKPAPSGNAQEQADALSALSNLGYGPGDAAGAVAEAAGAEPGLSAEGLIRAALKLLAPKG